MDYGTLRGLIALLILALFVIIVVWSYSKKRKATFDKVASSIFDDNDMPKTNKQSHLDKDSKQESK
jgi:cytochrome c oxidase cbb3-type subunit 4